MGQFGLTDCQRVENLRAIFQLAHERNENLVYYIRVTDGAIWGFLGLTVIEFFKEGFNFKSETVAIFCVILIVSMFLWRNRVNLYQESIVKGYNRMVNCEYCLDVPYQLTIRKNLEADIQKNPYITNKPKSFDELCELLKPENYKHPGHIEANFCARIIEISAILIFILWIYQWIV